MQLRSFTDQDIPSFANHLVTISEFLPEADFRELKEEIDSLSTVERGYVPTHKKGGTIVYDYLQKHAPKTVAFYQSPAFLDIISRIIGERVVPTPQNHPTSLSILIYDRPGDHIGWHYDPNFYKGRFFTVLLAIENRGEGENGLSSANLMVRKKTGDIVVPTPANLLVLFEGVKVLHRVTQVKAGERRVILSMTYCTNPAHSLPKEIMRRVKDMAFVGIRALWK